MATITNTLRERRDNLLKEYMKAFEKKHNLKFVENPYGDPYLFTLDINGFYSWILPRDIITDIDLDVPVDLLRLWTKSKTALYYYFLEEKGYRFKKSK